MPFYLHIFLLKINLRNVQSENHNNSFNIDKNKKKYFFFSSPLQNQMRQSKVVLFLVSFYFSHRCSSHSKHNSVGVQDRSNACDTFSMNWITIQLQIQYSPV